MKTNNAYLLEDEIGKSVHEIKNLLTLMQSSFQLIEREHPQVNGYRFWNETKSDMDEILRLTNAISGERRRRIGLQAGEQLLEALSTTAETLRVICDGRGIRLTYSQEDMAEAPISERAFDIMAIKRSMINLVKNAAEACRKGDSIDIEVRQRDIGERKYLIIDVSDTGAQVPDGVKDMVFEENFTTKSEGCGKGLAVVKETAMAHGGYVTLESNDGSTTFSIYLPLA